MTSDRLPLRLCLDLAVSALARNRLQTTLAVLGMTVGVGSVVTSMALGNGAQQAINDQLRAAGANVILVTAGNYKVKGEDVGGGTADHYSARKEDGMDFAGSSRNPSRRLFAPEPEPRADYRLILAMHPEDDPMAVHNHPTAKQRLGDSAAGLGSAATLTRADADAIRREIPGVQLVASGVHENVRVFNGEFQWFTRLHGGDTELPRIRRGWAFTHGGYFAASDIRGATQTVVLGKVAADKLFGPGANPLGREVRIWKQPFTVAGVVTSRSWAVQPATGDDQFDAVYVPFTTIHRLLNLTKLNTITVTTTSVGETTRVARDIVALLRTRHRIGEAAPDDFTVRTQAQQALGHGLPPSLARVVSGNLQGVEQVTIDQLSRAMQRANWTMLSLLAGVATVSLVVGGIGIMNILLLSVTERTREIGLRLAVGARRSDVLVQFVSESIVLSLAGGALGIVFGAIASGGLAQIFRWAAVISPASIVIAIVASTAVGLGFGVMPARRAAGLDPIEALRHE
jgi:putative ABC transport system permease protein